MISRFLEWFGNAYFGGPKRHYFRCELGHISYNGGDESRCWYCGSQRYFRESAGEELATRWAMWKYDKKWLPHRVYSGDKMWWEWMGRDWRIRPHEWPEQLR